jgi:nitrile hydratase beta subunit
VDGIHDMGGVDGFGKVEPEKDEPVFHAPWEGRVLAMTRAMGYAGAWVIDQSRYAGERLPPHVYLTAPYYKRWMLGIETNAVERGLVGPDELAAGTALRPGKKLPRMLTPEAARKIRRGGFARKPPGPARFKVGDRVRAKNIHPATHTRLPRYVRGHVGTVERIIDCHVFPDTMAIDAGENPQWLYAVVFAATELWGPDADPTVKVSVDAFEPYIEPA